MESNDSKIDSNTGAFTGEREAAVNPVILDYYKKFGRKRDLEQYFSLTTAQGEVRDPAGLFWRRMKSQTDSSDSSEKKSESSAELCRISIRCSVPEESSSQDEASKGKGDSESPPIITEDGAARHTDDESNKSDDNHSRKSIDAILDTSTNKPLSPSSSITSQRKLEWDSLADVGYGNESDRKTSASSLSTLEKLALKQQYSNNDTDLGLPTAHSTPLEQADVANKNKKSKKTTTIRSKDFDVLKLNMSHTSDSRPQAINVNLTKHISFNVEEDGGVTVENIVKNVSVSPEKVAVETEAIPQMKLDKEIQTTLTKTKEKIVNPVEKSDIKPAYVQKVPVLINLNTLRKRKRRNKLRNIRRKIRARKNEIRGENVPLQEKCGSQVSEAESFEYMPGHIYNQNQLKHDEPKLSSAADNKSSLESSGALTTDSSKGSKHSFTKDLEKSIDIIKAALQNRYDDSNYKKKLIKEVVLRLIKSRYRDDDSTTDFLSGLSFQSKKMGYGENHTTTSTSDGNHTEGKSKLLVPKKSILRLDKFNSNGVPSTSQSAPNLPSVSNCDKLVMSNLSKVVTSSNTDSDVSSKERNSSETGFAKTSSEELYQKYLEALKREESYKRHLRDKEHFLRQKLVNSDTAFKMPVKSEFKTNYKLKDLIKDLTRNNNDDGSGDASKLKVRSTSNVTDFERSNVIKKHRSHSVFTLSSGNSECNRKSNLKKRLQNEIRESKTSNNEDLKCLCGCQMHSKHFKIDLVDSSVQVNIKRLSDNNSAMEKEKKLHTDSECCKASTNNNNKVTGDIRYVCLCSEQGSANQEMHPNMFIYKCSRLQNKGIQLEVSPSTISHNANVQCTSALKKQEANICEPSTSTFKSSGSKNDVINNKNVQNCFCDNKTPLLRSSQSSQTNIELAGASIFQQKPADGSLTSSSESNKSSYGIRYPCIPQNQNVIVHEATRSIQTEISINPKISDPVLSDVNVIEDGVKLIDEKYRKLSKSNVESDSNKRSGSSTEVDICSAKSGKSILQSSDAPCDPENNVGLSCCLPMPSLDKEVQSNIKANNIESHTMTEPTGENYEIPIHGTNMKLTVTIGSNTRKSPPVGHNNTDTIAIQACCTEKIEVPKNKSPLLENYNNYADQPCDTINTNVIQVAEKSCLTGQCTQGTPQIADIIKEEPKVTVQSQTANKIIGTYQDIDCCNGANVKKLITPEVDSIKLFDSRKSCIVNEPDANKKTKCNTYPRSVQINVSKPFKRTNTDCRIKYATDIQTDSTVKNNAATQESKIESEKDDIDSQPDKYSFKESLRCGTSNKEAEDTLSDDPIPSSKSSNDGSKDAILDIIKDITRRYSKKDIEKDKRKKCFKEIINVLNYLLATENDDDNQYKICGTSSACRGQSDKKVSNKEETNNFNNNNNETDSYNNLTPRENEGCSKQRKQEKIHNECCLPQHENQDEANMKNGKTKLKMIDKAVQLCPTKFKGSKRYSTESSEMPKSTDLPTSSDSATCKVLNKIKRECEKYHQKRCKCSHTAAHKCDISSSTSMNCDQCQRVHHCSCRGHKCKTHKHKPSEKNQRKCLAYNLIIQTSDSIVSEEISDRNCRPLQNIIVKVPSKRKQVENVPFKELSAKIEKNLPNCCPRRGARLHRSRSLPNDSEVSSIDDGGGKRDQGCSVREYLERNRPEFVERSSDRQNCLKIISERRNPNPCSPPNMKMVVVHNPPCMGSVDACNMFCGGIPTMTCVPSIDLFSPNNQRHHAMQNEVTRIADERAAHRELLSLQLATQPDVSAFSDTQLRDFAKQLGFELRNKKLAPKFISEKEMKKHSEKIYKSLPEVVQKKEDRRKENIKKTNLVMANIFKKNLQKKTLRGAVNLSNYSTVIKI